MPSMASSSRRNLSLYHAHETNSSSTVASAPTISKADDRAMDAADSKAHMAPVGVSIRNGPVGQDRMDIDSPVNGQAKRKSRASVDQSVNYKDESSDDEAPLVGFPVFPAWYPCLVCG